MPVLPNSLLLIVLLMAIFVGSANAIFDATLVNYTGHIYCNVSTIDGTNGTSNTIEGSLVLPVQNVSMKLMETDEGDVETGDHWLNPDDQLGTCRTEADGSFTLTGSESEIDGLEPYFVLKACRTDDPSICSVEKRIIVDINRDYVMVAENFDYYMDTDFCQQICKDGVCQSA